MQTELIQGTNGRFQWLTSTEDYMGTFLDACPFAVHGRYLAVVSTDSGAPRFRGNEVQRGFRIVEDVLYGPVIEANLNLPPYQVDGLEVPGYDEWYIFPNPVCMGQRVNGNVFEPSHAPQPGRVCPFASYFAFVLSSPDPLIQPILDLFWSQLERINPESYLADGSECLSFVSQNRELFENVYAALSRPR